jgi:PAS domain S-box-containing protein
MPARTQTTDLRLGDFFDRVDQLMAILELADGELVFMLPNRSLAAFLETPADSLKRKPVGDYADLDDRLKRWLEKQAKGATRSSAVFTFECQLRNRDPAVWLECRIYPMPDRTDGSAVFGFVAMDISERKNAQAALDEVEEQLYEIIDLGTGELETTTESLRIIIDEIPVMICCYDISGGIRFVNRAFEDLVGWSTGDPLQLDVMAACHPDPTARGRMKEFMMRDGADWEDFRLCRRSGEFFETSWTNVPLTPNIRIGIGIDITKRKQAEAAVRRLSRKSMEMLENDRQSVAKELHDSIGASLAAIKFGLEGRVRLMGAPPAECDLPLEAIIAHLADTIKESKRISNGLRPLTLDDLGLIPTLTAYIRKLNAMYPDVAISQDIAVDETELPEMMKIVLYRVVQEALNNINKHSGATKACLRLKRCGSTAQLEIADNGCGFDPETAVESDDPFSGHGLRSMRERMEICGGSFEIRSSIDSGTTIRATVPLT